MYQGHEDRPLAGIDGGCDFDGTRVTVITGGGSSQSGRHGMYLKPALNTGRILSYVFKLRSPVRTQAAQIRVQKTRSKRTFTFETGLETDRFHLL